MSTLAPMIGDTSATVKENGAGVGPPEKLDAGALFVLKSRGN